MDLGEVAVEGDDAGLAGFVGELDELLEDGFAVVSFVQEDADDGFERSDENAERELQHDSAGGAADNDHGGGGLGDLGDAAAFNHHAGQDADDGEGDASDACDVHGVDVLNLEAGMTFSGVNGGGSAEGGEGDGGVGPGGAQEVDAVGECEGDDVGAGFADEEFFRL